MIFKTALQYLVAFSKDKIKFRFIFGFLNNIYLL
ncbi:MAG: hypothetical protein POELPBGB_03447 [Bacteroidia bacterium]|nr:hypothetical protein [Bacteroidia bacterium]